LRLNAHTLQCRPCGLHVRAPGKFAVYIKQDAGQSTRCFCAQAYSTEPEHLMHVCHVMPHHVTKEYLQTSCLSVGTHYMHSEFTIHAVSSDREISSSTQILHARSMSCERWYRIVRDQCVNLSHTSHHECSPPRVITTRTVTHTLQGRTAFEASLEAIERPKPRALPKAP
jgi:hypothetical protein